MKISLVILIFAMALASADDDDRRDGRRGNSRGEHNQQGNNTPNTRFLGGLINTGANLLGGLLGGSGVQVGFGGRPNRPIGGFGNRPPRPVVGGFGGAPISGGFGGGNVGGVGGFGGPPNSGGFASSSGCRYWCRTNRGQRYCCENNQQAPGFVGVKPGQCPPVRPSCPPTRNFGPPTQCSNDGSCGGADKCCFDTCLQHHTCKAPLSFGFGR